MQDVTREIRKANQMMQNVSDTSFMQKIIIVILLTKSNLLRVW